MIYERGITLSARLIIVRHAQASGNREGRFQCRKNNELTELGKQQLTLLSERLRNTHIDAVISSPLSRAMDTARACIEGRDLNITTDPRIIEIDAGEMESLLWEELYERYPEQMAHWKESPHLFCPPGGETMAQLYERVSAAAEDIAARYDGKTVLISTHGVVVRNLMCWAKRLPFERLCEVQRWSNTGIGIVDVTDGEPMLISEDDHAHLAPLEGAQ